MNVEIPVTQAIIEMIQIFAETDYRSSGVTLADLGLDDCKTSKEMIEYITAGDGRG